MRRPS
ncbi:hypothetical protein LINGRAPRIM_LOCUS1514 [Linum grandiflorum]